MLKKILIVILFFFVILILSAKAITKPVVGKKININIDKEEIGLTFLYSNSSKSLLISNKRVNILLMLDNANKLIDIYKYFNIKKINYVLSSKKININIKFDNQIILKDNIEIQNILFKPNNYGTDIYYDNHIVNIIDGDKVKNNHVVIDGKFVYIYHINKKIYIKLNDNIEVLFYNQDDMFSNKFLEHIYGMWLDTYTIQQGEYTTLKLGINNFRMITIPNYN
jgi:hypothetical protein